VSGATSKPRPNRPIADTAELAGRMHAVLEQANKLQPVRVGATPRECVYREGSLSLYRYGKRPETGRPPVVIVYSLVNRPYILDLNERRSFIRALVDSGRAVYLVDWGYPEPADRFLGLEDYVNGLLRRSVRHVRSVENRADVDLLGVCQGGTLALCYASLHPSEIGRLITLVTPVDFHSRRDVLHHLTAGIDVDTAVDTLGNLSSELLNTFFVSLKPYRLLSQRYVAMASLADNTSALTEFLQMERWMYDSPDQAGEAFREFAKYFYQNNGLVRGNLDFGCGEIDLNRIRSPILNVYATEDHLVPSAAATALSKFVDRSLYNSIAFEGGHLGVFVSGKAQRTLYPRITEWLDNPSRQRACRRSSKTGD